MGRRNLKERNKTFSELDGDSLTPEVEVKKVVLILFLFFVFFFSYGIV